MYRQILDKIALNNLTKMPNIPDYHLMVGSAEDLCSQPLLVYKNANIPKEIAGNLAKYEDMTQEQIAQAIADNIIEVNDVNSTVALLGLGGV